MMDSLPIPQLWLLAWGWTVIHSLWQGTLIALILAFALRSLKDESAQVRHNLIAASMFFQLLCLLVTFHIALEQPGFPAAGGFTTESSSPTSVPISIIYHLGSNPTLLATAIGWLWLIGVLIMSMRALAGFYRLSLLKHRGVLPLPDEWRHRIQGWLAGWEIQRRIPIYLSQRISSPSVLGFFQQAIYLPVSFLSGTPQDQVRVILAHEVAHCLRRDALVNLVQSFLEIIQFYHPAIWWMSRKLRDEREYCCDDYAIEKCGQPILMARALMDLQNITNRMAPATPGLSAAGRLRSRIERLFITKEKTMDLGQKLLAILFILGVGLVILPMQSISKNLFSEFQQAKQKAADNVKVTAQVQDDAQQMVTVTDSLKKDSSKLVVVKEGEESHTYTIKSQDGKVVSVEKDGKVIPKEELDLRIDTEKEFWHGNDGKNFTIKTIQGDSCKKTITIKVMCGDKAEGAARAEMLSDEGNQLITIEPVEGDSCKKLIKVKVLNKGDKPDTAHLREVIEKEVQIALESTSGDSGRKQVMVKVMSGDEKSKKMKVLEGDEKDLMVLVEPSDADSCAKTFVVKIAKGDKAVDLLQDDKSDKKVVVLQKAKEAKDEKMGEKIKSELIKDGLFSEKSKTVEFKLAKSGLYINGVKQGKKYEEKYQHMVQEMLGPGGDENTEIKLKYVNK